MMSGLFSWVWDLLYAISKSMYAIIDNLLKCANMLCGIVPIQYKGADTDFLSFLLRNPNITYAFVGAVLVGLFLVVLFAIIAIIRTVASEKIDKTPAQIAVQVGKTMLTFLFIPAALTILVWFTNTLMNVLYEATSGQSPDGLGRFLAGAFGQNALKSGVPSNFYLDPEFNYSSTGNVKNYLNLSDYDFFFSYIASICILLAIGVTLLMFVDRAFAVVILFIFSPISLSTSVLDDGARFKLWRDQFLVKFLTGYGCIIGINIYALVVAAVTQDGLVFWPDSVILNNLMKILIILGGGVSLQKLMALVGNLISAGAGSNEMRDAAIAAGGFSRGVMGAARVGMGVLKAPFSASRSAWNFMSDAGNYGTGSAIAKRLGFRTQQDYAQHKAYQRMGQGGMGGGFGTGNNKAGVNGNLGAGGKVGSAVNNVLNGGNNNGGGAGGGNAGAGGNANNKQPAGNSMVNNAVNSSLQNQNQNNANKGNNKK